MSHGLDGSGPRREAVAGDVECLDPRVFRRRSARTIEPSRSADQRAEIDRLERMCRGRELALERLVEAAIRLRRGNAALQAENRELRLELQRLRHGTVS